MSRNLFVLQVSGVTWETGRNIFGFVRSFNISKSWLKIIRKSSGVHLFIGVTWVDTCRKGVEAGVGKWKSVGP